jgi:hypothetical protein
MKAKKIKIKRKGLYFVWRLQDIAAIFYGQRVNSLNVIERCNYQPAGVCHQQKLIMEMSAFEGQSSTLLLPKLYCNNASKQSHIYIPSSQQYSSRVWRQTSFSLSLYTDHR